MIPVNVITGFLGSGKTTLLREVLRKPEFSDTAVIVNEFGEVGLDHILLEEVEEGVLLLESGCICCTIRSDLRDTIRDLQARAAAGSIPKFSRLVVETTGLADPAPIASTLAADPIIRNHFRIGNIICTLDGMSGLATLANHPEAEKQLAIADRILLTKADVADGTQIDRLRIHARSINSVAQLALSDGQWFDANLLIEEDLNDPETRAQEIQRWFTPDHDHHDHHDHSHHGHHSHSHNKVDGLNSFVVDYDSPIDWTVFGVWLTALLHSHGDRILRVKGILNVRESETPVVLHGVQHVMHPPLHLDKWPGEDRGSHVIFITRGISEQAIRHSLEVFLSTAARATGEIGPVAAVV